MPLLSLGLSPHADAPPLPASGRLFRLDHLLALSKYLVLSTETHAFCAALAFFALLAFYPTSALLLTLAREALGGSTASVVAQAVREYVPEGQGFVLRNLQASVAQQSRDLQPHSVVFILLGAAGFFVPLETAFNRLWEAPRHRSYWMNQAVGLGLTLATASLAIVFVLVNAQVPGRWSPAMRATVLRATAVLCWTVAVFLFYRYLPNRPVRSRDLLGAALFAGVTAEVVRSLYGAALPLMNLGRSQGPFHVSVSFALLAYFEAFVLLGGAFLASEREKARLVDETPLREASDVAPRGV